MKASQRVRARHSFLSPAENKPERQCARVLSLFLSLSLSFSAGLLLYAYVSGLVVIGSVAVETGGERNEGETRVADER